MIKIVALSDQHGFLPDVPECQILFLAGDICPHFGRPVGGSEDVFGQSQWLNGPFRDWLDKVPAKHIIAVAGNHDWVFEKRPHLIPKSLRWTYLQDSGTEIEGLKIWGSPHQLPFYDWAYNLPEPDISKKWDMIPEDTDILVVHGPPFGYGDLTDDYKHVGSQSLTDRIMQIKPKFTCFGHIHSGRGIWQFSRGNMADGILANVSILDEAYRMVHRPMVFDI